MIHYHLVVELHPILKLIQDLAADCPFEFTIHIFYIVTIPKFFSWPLITFPYQFSNRSFRGFQHFDSVAGISKFLLATVISQLKCDVEN